MWDDQEVVAGNDQEVVVGNGQGPAELFEIVVRIRGTLLRESRL